MPWLGRDRHEPVINWPSHEQRAGSLVQELKSYSRHGEIHRAGDGEVRAIWVQRARQLTPEGLGSLLLLLIRRAAAEGGWPHDTIWRLAELNPRTYTVTAGEAVWALRTSASLPDSWQSGDVMSTALALAARAGPETGHALRTALETFSKSVNERLTITAPDRSKLTRGLAKLAPSEPADGMIDTSLIAPVDGWAAAVLAELSTWQHAAADVSQLLRHLATAAGSKPSPAWLAKAAQLLGDADARRLAQLLLETMTTAHGVNARLLYGGRVNLLLSGRNADIVRSAAWAAEKIGQPWVVPALQTIAYRAIHASGLADWIDSAKVPNACIYSLGAIASPEAIAALQHLQRTTKHAGFRKQIGAALTSAAQRSGVTPGQLIERVVPTASLDANSERHVEITAAATARIRITEGCRVVTEWASSEGWRAKAPAGTDLKGYAALRAAAKEVKDAVAGERSRLESLLADDRQWPAEEWRNLYPGHPVTGQLTRRLLWTAQTGSQAISGIPGADGQLLTLDGRYDIPAGATMRLWHPARAATAEVQGWRDRLVSDDLIQPFKQAYREIYVLTPAEQATRLYSNRFAAHILRYQQTFALMKQRNWTTNFLGPHDGGYNGRARREFADAGLTAAFDHYPVDMDRGDIYVDLCSTDRVFFFRTGDRTREPLPLDDVPELVFSEAMRDVDLFVSVTSIALDPQWGDRGDDPHLNYWNAFSFGELTETARVRRDALERLIPKLKIAERLELGDRFLRVRGRMHEYRIHVGSGNIQIEPDDRYLCIVPASSGRPRVMLPFDGDPLLSLILSKAILLAADHKITDPTILQQLKQRP
jgi:hypothetical protein